MSNVLSKVGRVRARRMAAVAIAAALAVGATLAVSQPAAARMVVGIGIGVPLYPAPYYPPYPYYYYPPPPPVVYAPPPPPAPPVAVNPASQTYVAPNGQTCREYQTNIVVNGQTQASYGTACLQPDGTWRIVN